MRHLDLVNATGDIARMGAEIRAHFENPPDELEAIVSSFFEDLGERDLVR